jgi:gas vesicle protein
MSISRFISGAILGGVIGAGMAILLAPASGEKLRTQMRQRAEQIRSEVEEAAANRRSELERHLAELRRPQKTEIEI